MNKEKKRKDPVSILLDIIIVALIFVTLYVGQSYVFYKIRMNEETFAEDAGKMAFELQRGDYAGLVQGKYMNEFTGNTETTGYHSLANYVEAAFAYKVYDAKNDAAKANEQKAIMDEARVKMEELTIFADKVDKMFMVK